MFIVYQDTVLFHSEWEGPRLGRGNAVLGHFYRETSSRFGPLVKMLDFKVDFNLYSVALHFIYIFAKEEGIPVRTNVGNSDVLGSVPSLPCVACFRITQGLPLFLPQGTY